MCPRCWGFRRPPRRRSTWTGGPNWARPRPPGCCCAPPASAASFFDTGYVLDEMLGLPEMAAAAGARAESGDWSAADAIRVAGMIGSGNARRVYRLG